MDAIVYDIIGRDSSVLDGFRVDESSGTSTPKVTGPSIIPSATSSNVEDILASPTTTPLSDFATVSTTHKKNVQLLANRKRKLESESEEMEKLKILKLTEQTTALKLDNHKRYLEVYVLEMKLGLVPSELTSDFMSKHYPS